MEARYLRVKNWARFQHYKDKEPGWIKLYADAIRDSKFLELQEPEQWQLVRVWVAASQGSRFTHDEKGRKVPVVPDDEQYLRRATASLKKVPLAKFIRDGWLIPVAEHELEGGESRPALDSVYSEPSPGLDPTSARSSNRGLEKELANASSLPATIDRPPKLTRIDNADLAFDTLQRLTGIDSRSQRTREVAVALSGSRGKPGIRRMFWEEQGGVKGEGFERLLAAEIEQRCGLYRRKMPGAALTPTAVQKWWFDMVGLPDPHDGRVLSIEERLWRHAGELEADERRSLDAG